MTSLFIGVNDLQFTKAKLVEIQKEVQSLSKIQTSLSFRELQNMIDVAILIVKGR